MWRFLAIPGLIICCSISLHSQSNYLDRPDLMALSDSCLHHTYNFSFVKARQFQQTLRNKTPDHPAPPFLGALILYWEHFPLIPDDPETNQFIELMDRSVALAQRMMEDKERELEGLFFDLFGRAFKAMFWADNGKSGKVIPDLRTMYKHTKAGFALKEQFSEFYFSTGLYNYYIEAYPRAHPVYKPLLSFMQEGDMELGLKQLNHAIHHSIYLRVEAMLFMSLIQLNYENDLNTAAIYAEKLYREYPGNIYYQGHLVAILLHLHSYDRVREVLLETGLAGSPPRRAREVNLQSDNYSEMIRQFSAAFLAERESGDETTAEKRYIRTIELAGSFGPFTDNYRAMGYMGLSRLYAKKNLQSESKRYARKAENHTAYRFILDE
ncbi:MAG: hypothetical protein ABFS10_00400 [Bacteroidota bacterium]